MSKKRYYIPGVDRINGLVETPSSKERTDRKRFIITTVLAAIAAIASVIAAVVSIMAYIAPNVS